MAYAVAADLVPRRLSEQELAQLTIDGDGGAVAIADVITEASAVVDSYCRQRYTLPLQSSEQVKALVLDIAIYKLFARRRRVPQDVKDAHDLAMKFLGDVSTGKASLDQPVGATEQKSSGGALATEIEEKFSDDNLTGFIT